MKVKPYIILNTSRKHVNYEEDKNKVPMNKPYNIQNTNICNGIIHISFFKALLINEGERESGQNDPGRNDSQDSGRNDLDSYYIYHKISKLSFVKILCHRDFRVFSTRRTPAWRNGLQHLKLR
jgi:hypothetical protein